MTLRILVLGLGVPFPPIGGGLTRTFHLLRSLAAHHQLTLAAFTYGDAHEPPPYDVDLRLVPWQWSRDYQAMTGSDQTAVQQAYQRLTFESDEPWFVSVMDPSAMNDLLAGAAARPYDAVLLEGMPLARFLPALPKGIPRVLDLFDIHTVMAERAARGAGRQDPALNREYERTLAFERNAVRHVDACLAVSAAEAAAARDLLGAPAVHVVPNGVDTSYFTAAEQPEPGMVLFTGRMSYGPNIDAVQYFARDILPRIRRDVPHAAFHIVGAAPAPDVAALDGDGVVVHGRVDDVRPFYRRAEVVVAPIRSGGGTRLKVLEAAACGKGIVSTALGAEGLPFRDGADLLIADSPGDFAAAVTALLEDPERRAQLGRHAQEAARAFDWVAIGESCRAIIETLVRDRA